MTLGWGVPELNECRDAAERVLPGGAGRPGTDIDRVMKLVAYRPILLDDAVIRRVWLERVGADRAAIDEYEETYRPYDRGESHCPFSHKERGAARSAARMAKADLSKLFLRDSRALGSLEAERRVCDLVRATHRALSQFWGYLKRDPRWQQNWERFAALSSPKRVECFEKPMDELEGWHRDVRGAVADATLKSEFRAPLVELIGVVPLPPTRRVGRDPFYTLLQEPKWNDQERKPGEFAWRDLARFLGTSEATLRRRIRRAGVSATQPGKRSLDVAIR